MPRDNKEYTKDWKLYLDGQNYNNKLDPPFYRTINVNNSMYIGDQWKGVQANGLPTPVFNIFKRIINHQIASITSQDTTIQLSSDRMDEQGEKLLDILTSYMNQMWEDTKMSAKIRELLLDGAISGDYSVYVSWDELVNTGQEAGMDEEGEPVKIMGDISNEIVDNVNVFFGNPNDPRVNDNGRPIQPYIVIAFREMTEKLRAEAKKNGVSKQDILSITGDEDNEYQAGERGQVELDDQENESAKTTAIIKLWPKDGKIYARKSTKHTVIRKEWDTKLSLYPVAWANWDI